MNSKIVPRALVAIPRTPTLCLSPRKLGFSSHLFNQSSRISSTMVSSGLNLDPLITAFARQRFVARAESDDGAGQVVEESETAVEESVEGEEAGEAELEEVAKEPRKPIVKLGDVMGVINTHARTRTLSIMNLNVFVLFSYKNVFV